MADLKTNLLGFVMNSPVIGASGTVGYGAASTFRSYILAGLFHCNI